MFKSIKIIPKIQVKDKETLALVYTPGVAASCLEIKKNIEASYDYTNRENSVAVFAKTYEDALKRAIFLKSAISVDAYPFEVGDVSDDDLKFLVENLEPSFGAFDLSLLNTNLKFDVSIPVLTGIVPDLKEFFLCVSKTLLLDNIENLTGSVNEKSLALRKMAGGVIETELSEDEHKKPVAILSDGSAILGLGNIGAEAGMPVMEGKAVLFKSLGDVDALPLCVKTQNPQEVIKIAKLLENSFSGINLEDISAPNCFIVEQNLVEDLSIPVFHDDQHGTAIVVLAGVLNALTLAHKKLEDIKIMVSGAGAAATAVVKLLLKAGAKNVLMNDINGLLYKGRPENNDFQNDLCDFINLNNEKGNLKDGIKNADLFIGLSAPNLLDEKMIKSMANNPIIFALANPTPEIMPDKAKEYGVYIVASGRSDFANQINNSLVFPGLFKGLIEKGVKKVTDEIKLNTALAVAELVATEELNENYIIPDALDFRVVNAISDNI